MSGIENLTVRSGGVTIEYGNGAKATVEMLRDQLIGYRGKSPHPDELEWEIRLYEYILEDVEQRWRAYGNARHVDKGFRTKREAVKSLGWEIA